MKFNCQMKQTHIEFRDYLTLTRVHQIKNLPGEDFMKAYSINIRKYVFAVWAGKTTKVKKKH